MTAFTAQLFDLLDKADRVSVDGFEVDDEVVYHSSSNQYEVDLTVHDPSHGFNTFDPQEVEVSDGDVSAKDTEGHSHLFEFRVSRPIRQEDLA